MDSGKFLGSKSSHQTHGCENNVHSTVTNGREQDVYHRQMRQRKPTGEKQGNSFVRDAAINKQLNSMDPKYVPHNVALMIVNIARIHGIAMFIC